MIKPPVGTLPVDFLTLFISHFRNLAGKPDGRDQGFQATIMKSSVDEVREKEIAFLQGNFDNVRFSENHCFAVHKGDAESLIACSGRSDSGERCEVKRFLYSAPLSTI